MYLTARIRPALFAALAALLWTAVHTVARAGDEPVSLRDALLGTVAQDGRSHQKAPLIALYVAGNGSRFTLDRTGNFALLRFERNAEVWALKATPGPGGDIIYKNDLGQPVLRATKFGGLTLFTPDQPGGAPAAFLSEVAPSRPQRMSPAGLLQVVEGQTVRLGRAFGHNIFIKAEGASGTEYQAADAINVACDTLMRMAALREGRPYAAQVRAIRVRMGKRPEIRFEDGLVDITIAPQMGVAGRPSSGRIAKTIVGLR